MAKTGYSKEDLNNAYYSGFSEGVKIHTEKIRNSLKKEIENGTTKIECGSDRLLDIINYANYK